VFGCLCRSLALLEALGVFMAEWVRGFQACESRDSFNVAATNNAHDAQPPREPRSLSSRTEVHSKVRLTSERFCKRTPIRSGLRESDILRADWTATQGTLSNPPKHMLADTQTAPVAVNPHAANPQSVNRRLHSTNVHKVGVKAPRGRWHTVTTTTASTTGGGFLSLNSNQRSRRNDTMAGLDLMRRDTTNDEARGNSHKHAFLRQLSARRSEIRLHLCPHTARHVGHSPILRQHLDDANLHLTLSPGGATPGGDVNRISKRRSRRNRCPPHRSNHALLAGTVGCVSRVVNAGRKYHAALGTDAIPRVLLSCINESE